MPLPDLTGQYIQDTYQRVLQVSGSGDIVDGTGSLFIPPNAISASYATSASYEINYETSSSFAETASYVNPLQQNVIITGSLGITGSNSDWNISGGGSTLKYGLRTVGSGIRTEGSVYISHKSSGGETARLFLGTTNEGMDLVRLNDSTLVLGGVTQNYGWRIFGIKHGLNGSTYTTEIDNLIATGSMQVTGSMDVDGVISGSIVVLNSGSAGVPSINFGNPNVGIYSSAAGYLNFQTGTSPGGSPEMEISNYILMRRYLSMNGNYISGLSNLTGSSGTLGISGSTTIDGALSVDGTSRTLFTSCSMVYSGSNVTQVTQSFQGGTQQITNILYSGSFADGNPLSVAVTGSDGINKLYTLTYSASLVTQILVT